MITWSNFLWLNLERVERLSPVLFWNTVYRVSRLIYRVRFSVRKGTFKEPFTIDGNVAGREPFVLNPRDSWKPTFREKFLIATGMRPLGYNFRFEQDFTPQEIAQASTEVLKILWEFEALAVKAEFHPRYWTLQSHQITWEKIRNRYRNPQNKVAYEIYAIADRKIAECKKISK